MRGSGRGVGRERQVGVEELLGGEAAFAVEGEEGDAIEIFDGPFAFGEEEIGVGTEGAEEEGELAVTPAEERADAVRLTLEAADEAG